MSRSVFEEVSDPSARRDGPAPGAAEAEKRRNRRRIAVWLLVLAAMVMVQIVVGGLTRLTDSGLSITDWRPVTGWLPPLSDAAWEEAFARYRETEEFRRINSNMTLEGFKPIFYWEWGHRVWGRLIGLAFVIPFLIFWLRGQIPTGWTGRILILGALGALQGVIGWWMVLSGLADRVDVSQHRLAAHLGLAFVILALLLWRALSLLREEWDLLQARRRREKPIFSLAAAAATLLGAQIVMGAYVAGLDAGRDYVDWPLMDGAFYPPGVPFAPFDEIGAAQFTHRLLAYLLIIAAAVFWWRARGSSHARTRRWATIFGVGVLLQTALGVVTVVNAAPLSWAIAHQLGAILIFAVLIHAKHQAAFPREERIAGAA